MGKYLIKIKKENEKKRAVPAKNKKKDEKPKSDTESISSDSSATEEKPAEAPQEVSVEELDFDEQLKLIMNVKNDPVHPAHVPESTVKSVTVTDPPIPIESRRSNQPVGSRGATVSSRRTF